MSEFPGFRQIVKTPKICSYLTTKNYQFVWQVSDRQLPKIKNIFQSFFHLLFTLRTVLLSQLSIGKTIGLL